MARYRKVDPRVWNDAKFAGLSDNGKLVFFMLLTHPSMTALGAMRATIPGLAAEMGWETEGFREAFAEAAAKGMAELDHSAHLIALPQFLKYNPPESPNVVKAWVGAVDLLPECELKSRVLQRAQAYAEGMTEAFGIAFGQTFGKAMPNQEQEKKQKQKQQDELACGPAVRESAPAAKAVKPKAISLASYLADREAEGCEPIPPTDAVWKSAEDAGLPREWVMLAWWAFEGRYLNAPDEKAKTYTSWPRVFRNAVRENWLQLWWATDDGRYRLSQAGTQVQREMEGAA